MTKTEKEYSILNHLSKMNAEFVDSSSNESELIESIENWLSLNMEVKSKSRFMELVDQRRMISFILKKNTNLTLRDIGKVLGGKDHGTIIHAIKTHRNLFSISDSMYFANTKTLREKYKLFL